MASSSWCLAARSVSMLVVFAIEIRPWVTVPIADVVGRTIVDVVAVVVVTVSLLDP